MHKFRVMECWAAESWLALQCTNGRHHLTRALNRLPPEGALLEGAKPHLGFGVLMCPASGAIFRVIFESINQTGPVFEAHWMLKTARAPLDARQGAAR